MKHASRHEGRERARTNWDSVGANWNQIRGKVKEQWGKLTDDDLDRIEGRREQLIGKVQSAYGMTAEEAEREVDRFMSTNSGIAGDRGPSLH